MKGMRILMSTLAVLVAAAPNAFAAETVRVFSSSILVLAFVGFLALIVVVQLIPAMVTLFAALKGLAKKTEETKVAEVKAGNKLPRVFGFLHPINLLQHNTQTAGG